MWKWLQNWVIGRGLKNLKGNNRTRLDFIKSDSSGGSEDEESRENLELLRDCLIGHVQNADHDTDSKGHSEEISEKNEDYLVQNWRKGH